MIISAIAVRCNKRRSRPKHKKDSPWSNSARSARRSASDCCSDCCYLPAEIASVSPTVCVSSLGMGTAKKFGAFVGLDCQVESQGYGIDGNCLIYCHLYGYSPNYACCYCCEACCGLCDSGCETCSTSTVSLDCVLEFWGRAFCQTSVTICWSNMTATPTLPKPCSEGHKKLARTGVDEQLH